MGSWRWGAVRHMRRPSRRVRSHCWESNGLWLSVLLAGALLGALILWFDLQLRPVLEVLAEDEARDAVTAAVNDAICAQLAENAVLYDDLVTMETDSTGRITALRSNMAGMNLLRAKLLDAALEEVEGLWARDLSIPLGSLLGMDVLSGRGPGVRAAVLSSGTAGAVFENEFTAAGVNQTLHRVWLEISVDIRVLLPGRNLEATVTTPVCVAETVIVGQVPETYLQLERGVSYGLPDRN